MLKRIASAVGRKIALQYAQNVSFDTAVDLARCVLSQRGFGSGSEVGASGEAQVFALIDSETPLLVDGGAFRGDYLSSFLKHHPSGQVIAIEPSRDHLELLEKTSAGKPVTIINCAVGAETGEAELYKDTAVSCIASLSQRRLDHFGISMPFTETVRVRRLDDILADIDFVDLLKIDIEGHELNALRGAEASFKAGKIGMVQFEFGGCNLDTRTTLQDFYYFFSEFGFALSVIGPRGITPLGTYREIYEQYSTTNYLARR